LLTASQKKLATRALSRRRKRLVELLAADSLSLRPRHVSLAGASQQQVESVPQPPPPSRKTRTAPVPAAARDAEDSETVIDGTMKVADIVYVLQGIRFRGYRELVPLLLDRECCTFIIDSLLRRCSH